MPSCTLANLRRSQQKGLPGSEAAPAIFNSVKILYLVAIAFIEGRSNAKSLPPETPGNFKSLDIRSPPFESLNTP